ncbi:hypothetical protein GCM10011386_01390 [Parapedobacter defluvii]|uniref:Neutral/alkaline non-lysosomal ceramidase N-terminal domain-containing protein n=1 Tax=Parapedobacter defluvii TaxID=2045106 RepID=A0ABQ1KXI8_9SPHI|nr:hypothetical protein [Parapedobacter defluvii]GGC13452.1 hypothetical protein GCM10011386_01390 [Parapedobacter defluvii]
MNQTVLKVGTGVSDITPALEVGFLTSSVRGTYAPFKSVRSPLKARAIALEVGAHVVVLVSLDLLGLSEDAVYGWERFKAASCGTVPVDNVIITCTHTHSAPESLALSDLYTADSYKQWLGQLEGAIRKTISHALNTLKPVSTVEISSSELDGFSLLRRIALPQGIVMSDTMQPVAADLFARRPIDRRVRVLRFLSTDGNSLASIVHFVCHPVHEMLFPSVSPDFPGELCAILESEPTNGFPMFLNGAAGNINPPTVSWGVEYTLKHAEALAKKIVEQTDAERETVTDLMQMSQSMDFDIRQEADLPISDARAVIRLVRIGRVAMVFIPGEPFVETALRIEQHSPFEHTIVVGYSECSVGYIPTIHAFEEGGYEVGPGKWSYLEADAEERIYREAVSMLNRLYENEINLANSI